MRKLKMKREKKEEEKNKNKGFFVTCLAKIRCNKLKHMHYSNNIFTMIQTIPITAEWTQLCNSRHAMTVNIRGLCVPLRCMGLGGCGLTTMVSGYSLNPSGSNRGGSKMHHSFSWQVFIKSCASAWVLWQQHRLIPMLVPKAWHETAKGGTELENGPCGLWPIGFAILN